MTTKISIKKISFTQIASFFIFCDLITIEYFQSPEYTFFQYICLMPAIIYCFKYCRLIFRSSKIYILISLLLSSSFIVSSYVNRVASYNIRGSIFFGTFVLVLLIFLLIVGQSGKVDLFLKSGRIYLFIILLINDLLMIIKPDQFYNINDINIGTCFLGNKFNVAYAHLMFLFISVILQKQKKLETLKSFFI